MIEKILSLQFGGFYGGDAGYFFSILEQYGLFSYVLPFLLIFAVVFGILTRTKIFKDNKAINGVLALTIALLSLQFNFVPVFFSEIFPRLGVGLAVILVALILLGLFMPEKNNKYVNWMFAVLALIVFVIVIYNSFEWTLGVPWGWYFYDSWPGILVIALVLGGIVAVMNSIGKKPELNVPNFPTPVYKS